MDYVSYGLLFFLAAVGGVWLLLSLQGSLIVYSMGKAKMTPLNDEEARGCLALVLTE